MKTSYKRLLQYKKSYRKHRLKCIEKSLKRVKRNLLTWINIIPLETSCQICGKSIKFMSKIDRLCFDHRYEGKEIIKTNPSNWLATHPYTIENEEIWKKCNFGILCSVCNSRLPTKNRKDFLLKAIKYVLGENEKI